MAISSLHPAAKEPNGHDEDLAIGPKRGERSRYGFTLSDCLSRLVSGGELGFSVVHADRASSLPAGVPVGQSLSSAGVPALAGPAQRFAAVCRLAVFPHKPGCRAWYRGRRTRLHYALHTSSEGTHMEGACGSVPNRDSSGAHSCPVVVLGHDSSSNSGRTEVPHHNDARIQLLAWIRRRMATEREDGSRAEGCKGELPAAPASPAIPRMRLVRSGNRLGNRFGTEGNAEAGLGRCAGALGCLMVASRRSAGSSPSYFHIRTEPCILPVSLQATSNGRWLWSSIGSGT